MGRHRLPSPKSSSYITPEGAVRLREELTYLWRVKRPQVTLAVSEAAAQGDRSENAEYIYGKKQLREIDRRIRYLQKRLDSLVIVDRAPSDISCIFFGAWVRLKGEDGDITRYRIVGSDETDLTRGYISIDSPLARALLKKSVDDQVTVTLPAGNKIYTVLEIRYMPIDDADSRDR
ncbi:MAG: transcription elongation factor GreB [Gammaproteobacteria bacterium]|nr:transcription elongation factor GreB [Gammaproteobacteria bacterium]MDH3370797.1 transcription elongation factor GreB [Gammaproteobacteria bacterium]MDH3407551.1 transcription elongation factor GreB [Gammaproteobacteria bacterium]MDH5487999.1 transcription elongation factor GreB [Gammaproteobacteria bacterium]